MKERGILILSFILLKFIILTIFFTFFASSDIDATGDVIEGNVNFSISSSEAIIVLMDSFDGDTTSLNGHGNLFLQDVSNLVLENSTYGKIVFNENVNLTIDAVDKIIDLDNNTYLTNNYIYINLENLTSLNKSALLYFYDVDFEDPGIQINGVDCPASICSEVSYSGNVYVVNITKFGANNYTSYSVVEKYEGVIDDGGGGGGGGGGRPSIIKQKPLFSVDKDLIHVELKVGDTERTFLNITNDYSTRIYLDINSTIEDFLIISTPSISLSPGASREVPLIFYSLETTTPGAYIGEIIVSVEGQENVQKRIPVIIEVESKKVLFDVVLEIPEQYKKVNPGEELLLHLTLFNLGEVGRVDVFIDYFIKDVENNVYYSQGDTIAVETQASFVKTINLPEDMPEGYYVAAAQVRYGSSVGTSTGIFKVIGLQNFVLGYKNYILLGVLILAIILIIIWYVRHENKRISESLEKEFRRPWRR